MPTQPGPTHFTLTMTGSAIQLSSVLAAISDLAFEPALAQLILSGAPGNAASIQIGSAGVSTSDYGCVVPKPVSSVPGQVILGPFPLRTLFLSQLYAVGTNNDKLQILIVPAVV